MNVVINVLIGQKIEIIKKISWIFFKNSTHCIKFNDLEAFVKVINAIISHLFGSRAVSWFRAVSYQILWSCSIFQGINTANNALIGQKF